MPINWLPVTKSGKLPLFLMCAIPFGFRERLLGKFLKAKFNIHYYRRVLGTTYFNQKEWDDFLAFIKAQEDKNPGYLLKLGYEFEKRDKKIIQFCKQYYGVDFSKMTLKEIEKIYRKFIDLKKKWLAPDYTYYIMDRYLPEVLTAEVNRKLQDKNRFNKSIEILTGLDRPTLIREEKLQFLKLTNLVKEKKLSLKSGKVQKLIKAHIKKYGFLNHYFYYFEPYTVKEIEQRIKKVLTKDLREEIRKIKVQEKNKELTQKIIKELGLSQKAQLIIKTLKQWGFCLNFLDEAGCLIHYYFKNFLNELAKRMDITYKMLIEMIFEEIDEFFKKGKVTLRLKIKLKERVRAWGFVWQGKALKVYSGPELERLEKAEIEKMKAAVKDIKTIKGTVASPGKVKGKVRVLDTYRDIATMKKGEVLVAPKTTPKFVPAMEKAIAIITDEGGLLSHAAIVSRELKIPCIVGTKIGTKALKNGQLVEVNANEGIIRIISKR